MRYYFGALDRRDCFIQCLKFNKIHCEICPNIYTVEVNNEDEETAQVIFDHLRRAFWPNRND